MINGLSKGALTELKGLAAPPEPVKTLFMVICILFGIKPDVKKNP